MKNLATSSNTWAFTCHIIFLSARAKWNIDFQKEEMTKFWTQL